MAKHSSVSKAKKKAENISANKVMEIPSKEIGREPNELFDFGGLQIHDLKKNLGCG